MENILNTLKDGGESSIHLAFLLIRVFLAIGMLFGAVYWIISDQTRNVKNKKKATVFLVVFISLFYFVRFGSIFILSTLFSNGIKNINETGIVGLLRIIQVIILSFVPTFCVIESYIFKYQFLIKKTPDSQVSQKKWITLGLGGSGIAIGLLQLLIGLF